MNKTAGRLRDDIQRLELDKKELGRQHELPLRATEPRDWTRSATSCYLPRLSRDEGIRSLLEASAFRWKRVDIGAVELLADKKELGRKMAELEVAEAGLRRSSTQLGEQLDFERDKRECLEKELLDAAEEPPTSAHDMTLTACSWTRWNNESS